jgi:hypothetical protein
MKISYLLYCFSLHNTTRNIKINIWINLLIATWVTYERFATQTRNTEFMSSSLLVCFWTALPAIGRQPIQLAPNFLWVWKPRSLKLFFDNSIIRLFEEAKHRCPKLAD